MVQQKIDSTYWKDKRRYYSKKEKKEVFLWQQLKTAHL
jgi:hypothetical protein